MDTPPRPGDRVRHAAGHWDERRAQLLARAWPHANCSCADPGCAHSSAPAIPARAGGGLTMILPKPSLRLKPRGTDVGIPPARGTSSRPRLAGDSVVCGVQMGVGCRGNPRPLPGTTACRNTGNKLIPTSHHDAKTQLLLKDGCRLQTIFRLW